MEVPDDACSVLLSSTGLLARTTTDEPLGTQGERRQNDVLSSIVPTTGRGNVGVVTSAGRVHSISVMELPTLPSTNDAPSLSGGAPLAAFVDLAVGEQPLALCLLTGAAERPGLVLGTRSGVIKRVNPDYPAKDVFEVIGLKDGDAVVGAVELTSAEDHVVFFTSDANLLMYAASLVRPQGRAGGGMAGVKLNPRAHVVGFHAVTPDPEAVVVTVSGASGALPGTEAGSAKVSLLSDYPTKGRATSGVRCHRFLRGEDALVLGWAGAGPAKASSAGGAPIQLPRTTGRRDGSGESLGAPVYAVG